MIEKLKKFLFSNAYPEPVQTKSSRYKTEQGRLEEEFIKNLRSELWFFSEDDSARTNYSDVVLENKINGTKIIYKKHYSTGDISLDVRYFRDGYMSMHSERVIDRVENLIELLKKRRAANIALNKILVFRQLIDCMENWPCNKFHISSKESSSFSEWLKNNMKEEYYSSMEVTKQGNVCVKIWASNKEDHLLLLLKYEGK